MKKWMILLGIALGGGLMYALDPEQGNRRRALARDKLSKAVHKTGRAVGATSRDVANRATGLAATLHSRFFEDNAPDDVVEARVRARLGRIASHPSSIEVTAHEGVITLRGPALGKEVAGIVRHISSVRGVTRVDTHLEAHDSVEHVAGLQGRARTAVEGGFAGWPPALKLAIGAAGAVLTTVGLFRRDKAGMVLGGMGLAIVTRVATDPVFEKLGGVLGREEAPPEARGVSIPVKFGPAPGGPRPGGPAGPVSNRIH